MTPRDWLYPALLLGLVAYAVYAARKPGARQVDRCIEECLGMGYPEWLCRQMCARYSVAPQG